MFYICRYCVFTLWGRIVRVLYIKLHWQHVYYILLFLKNFHARVQCAGYMNIANENLVERTQHVLRYFNCMYWIELEAFTLLGSNLICIASGQYKTFHHHRHHHAYNNVPIHVHCTPNVPIKSDWMYTITNWTETCKLLGDWAQTSSRASVLFVFIDLWEKLQKNEQDARCLNMFWMCFNLLNASPHFFAGKTRFPGVLFLAGFC